jgi:hypothetical protein
MALTVLTPNMQTFGEGGAVPEFYIKIEGIIGDATGGLVLHTILNPFGEDLVITKGLLVVTTASGNVATDLDIGLGDNAAGLNNGAELCDGAVAATLNTAGVKDLSVVHAIAAPPAVTIWKAAGSSTDSYMCIDQNGSVDASALRATLCLKCAKYKDLV